MSVRTRQMFAIQVSIVQTPLEVTYVVVSVASGVRWIDYQAFTWNILYDEPLNCFYYSIILNNFVLLLSWELALFLPTWILTGKLPRREQHTIPHFSRSHTNVFFAFGKNPLSWVTTPSTVPSRVYNPPGVMYFHIYRLERHHKVTNQYAFTSFLRKFGSR